MSVQLEIMIKILCQICFKLPQHTRQCQDRCYGIILNARVTLSKLTALLSVNKKLILPRARSYLFCYSISAHLHTWPNISVQFDIE